MDVLICPECDKPIPATGKWEMWERWAGVAVSTTIAAPAVPDMATRMRCPSCQHLFTRHEVRYQRASFALSAWLASATIAVCLAVLWQLFATPA